MERRALVEIGGATAISAALAAVVVYVLVDGIYWPLVVGTGMMAALAAAANYQARTSHSDAVADEAPVEEGRQATAAGDGATDDAAGDWGSDDAASDWEGDDVASDWESDDAAGDWGSRDPASDAETGDGAWGEETR